MNIIEYAIPHDQGQKGFGYVYDKSTDTLHLTGGAFHWELMREAPVDFNRDIAFTGYVNQEDPSYPGIETMTRSINGMDELSSEDEQRIEEALQSYLYKDPRYLNDPDFNLVAKTANIQQIFDAQGPDPWIKALYFSEGDTLYWWYPDDADGVPTHAQALTSFGLEWDDLQKKRIIPILGGEIEGYNEPYPVDWIGDEEEQARATQLLNELLENLRSELRDGGWVAKVASKIIEVDTQHGLGGMGGEIRRPVVFIPELDTMFVGNYDASHASVIAVIDEQFLKDFPTGHGYTGDDRWEHYGYWEYYYEAGDSWINALTDPQPNYTQVSELIDALTPKKNPRVTNIYDPIEEDLDKHVFKNGEPRQAVVNFIKRLYGRALKQEYGIENAELFIDLYITGSLTTFQYSETSDCDVSVFPNYQRFAESFGEDSSKTRKRLVALSIEHIDGTFLPGTTHPLQFFVVADGIERTDLYAPGLRSAWSIFDEMWVVPPEKERSHEVAAEFPDAYSRASSMATKMTDALDHDPESARELWKQVHKKRQLDQMAGLGDYSEGNIVYKWLLHEGLFDRIKNELHEYIAKVSTDGLEPVLLMEQNTSKDFIFIDHGDKLLIGDGNNWHAELEEDALEQGIIQSKGGFAYGWGNPKTIQFYDPQPMPRRKIRVIQTLAEAGLLEDTEKALNEAEPARIFSAAEGMTDEDEIRWGYNKATGEVKSVKAWGHDIVTHMDMASDWLGGDLSYDEMESQYEDLFFGYAYWDKENQEAVDIQPYSLDMQSEDYKLAPADWQHIQDQIDAAAPMYMG